MKRYLLAATISALLLSGCNEKTPVQYTEKGEALYNEGDYKSASIEFKNALQVDPDFATARLGLAKLAIEDRRYDAAIEEVSRVLPVVEKGSALYILANELQARAMHRGEGSAQILEIESNGNAEISFYHTVEYVARGDAEKAREVADSISNSDFYKTLAQTVALSAENELDRALKMIESITPSNEVEEVSYYLLKSGLMVGSQNIEGAIESLAAYIKIEKNDYSRALQLADMYVRVSDFKAAKKVITPLVRKFPQHGMINQINSVVAYEEEDYQTAVASAALATVDQPNNVMARLVAAYSHDRLDNNDLAKDNLDFIIDQLPANHPAQRFYVSLQAREGNINDVAKRALALSDLSASDVPLLSTVGLELARSGDIKQATKLKEMAETLGADGEGASGLGLLQLTLNDESGIKTLEAAFEKDPESAQVGGSLATGYLSSGKFKEAINLGEQMIKQGKIGEGKMLQSIALSRMGEYSESLSLLGEVLVIEPENMVAKIATIENLVANNQRDDAQSKMSSWAVGELAPPLYRAYVAGERTSGGQESMIIGSQFINKLLTSDTKATPQAKLVVAQSQFVTGEVVESVSLLKSIEDVFSTRTDYWLLRSSAQLRAGDLEGAIGAYQSWSVLEKENPMPVIGMLRIYGATNQYKKGLALIDERIGDFKDPAPGELIRVQFLISDGQMVQAKAYFERLPRELRTSVVGKGFNGIIELSEGKKTGVIEKIKPLFDSSPSVENARYMIMAYNVNGQSEKAVELMETFLKNDPESGVIWFMLGNTKAASDDVQGALVAYKAAVKYGGSNNPFLLNNLAYLQTKANELDGALNNINKAREISPTHPSFVDTHANVLIKLGKKEDAKTLIDDYLAAGNLGHDALLQTRASLN